MFRVLAAATHPHRRDFLSAIGSLLALGEQASKTHRARVSELAETVLGAKDFGAENAGTGRGGGASALNHDGYPLQLCFSCDAERVRLRLIGDPAWHLGDPAERLAISRVALRHALAITGSVGLASHCEALLDRHCPAAEAALRQYNRGLVWLGAGLDASGLALYADAKALGARPWEGIARWFVEILPGPQEALSAVAALQEIADPASLGFEGIDESRARAKIYWRLKRPRRLDSFGLQLYADPRIAEFLARVVGERRMSLSGTVFSTGFDLATGALCDAKVDLCGHCLPQPGASWVSLIGALCTHNALQVPAVQDALASGQSELAFLGFALNRQGKARLNVYLKPPGLGLGAGPLEVIAERGAMAAEFLCAAQAADGSWSEYQLPVGPATQWVTAFLGLALAQAGQHARHPRALQAAHSAAESLNLRRSYAVGWGYNKRTGPDADTTGLVLRLFRLLRYPVRREDEGWLLGRWHSAGGFSTYDGPQHWGDVHPCVTAVAWHGLSASWKRRLGPAMVAYLQTWRRSDGTWPAYWWRTGLYSTYHHMRLLREVAPGAQNPVAIEIGERPTAFDLAHAAGIEAFQSNDPEAARPMLERLLLLQRADGGWSGGYDLRVTDPDCAAPWDAPRGQLYKDNAGLISTAAALMVLTEMDHVTLDQRC